MLGMACSDYKVQAEPQEDIGGQRQVPVGISLLGLGHGTEQCWVFPWAMSLSWGHSTITGSSKRFLLQEHVDLLKASCA